MPGAYGYWVSSNQILPGIGSKPVPPDNSDLIFSTTLAKTGISHSTGPRIAANWGDPIRCNFFDNRDQNSYIGVGEDPSGDALSVQYEDWLQVEAGEEYYLLINNFSNIIRAFHTVFRLHFSGFSRHSPGLLCYDNLLGSARILCENETEELNASTPGAVGYQWYADIGAGFTALPGEDNPTYTVAQEGLYRVVIDLSDLTNIISDVQVSYTQTPVAYPVKTRPIVLLLAKGTALIFLNLTFRPWATKIPTSL